METIFCILNAGGGSGSGCRVLDFSGKFQLISKSRSLTTQKMCEVAETHTVKLVMKVNHHKQIGTESFFRKK